MLTKKESRRLYLFYLWGRFCYWWSSLSEDKLRQGGIALKGKPMNVSQATIKDILNNQEFSDIMASIGLVIGQPIEKKHCATQKLSFWRL